MPIRIDLAPSVGPRAKRNSGVRVPAHSGATHIPANSGAQRISVNSGTKRTPAASRATRRSSAGRRHEARWIGVLDISEIWRVGEDWWRERPIRRTYFRLVVQDGRTVTVFHDELAATLTPSEAEGAWFEQRY